METPVAGGFTKRFDIPLSHLDFDYVKNCSDVKELEKILKVLKSNEEGYFPDLERCCEERLTDLSPNSRVLRKDKPVATKSELDRDEREEIDNDLKNWTSNMKNIESGLTPTPMTEDTELPPIRSGSITLTAEGAKSSTTTETNKRVMPREYRDWDKIDIDKELEKVDEQGDKAVKEKTVVGNKEVRNIPDHVNVTGLSEQEKLLKANREKDKGNEAFKAGDFKEAISYYTRSISLQPTAASYNNRALAYLKHEDWQKALADTNTVMKMDPSNIKALLRRGSAYKGLKQYGKAKIDLKSVLDLEPKNKKAQDMIGEIEKIEQKEKEERKTKGRRMVIEDVDGTEDESTEEEKPKMSEPPVEKKQPRRMQIQEVESEEEEEEEEERDYVKEGKDIPSALANGHASPSEKQGAESVINNSCNKDEQVVDGGNTTAIKAEAETSVKSAGIDNLSNVSDVQKNIDTTATAETSARESELADDRSEHINEKSFDDKVTEEIKQAHVEDGTAEQTESNTVMENDTSETVSKDDDSQEGGNSDKVNDSHVFKRPVFFKLEFPENCVSLREEANSCFKNGQFGDGCEKYSKLINILEKVPDQIVNLSLTYSNRAACHLKTGDLPSVVKDCTKSLKLVPHSFKPLLRRALAYEHLERYDKAYVDYRHILLIDQTVKQAHLGTQRCQEVLSKKDGPKWREKIQLKHVSQWEIPEIQDISGKDTPQEEKKPKTVTDKPKQAETEVIKEIREEAPKEEEVLTTQEKFEKVKAQGNLFVQQGKFREAVECYTECSAILPDESVSYTNRALCYIRLNQAEKAELDCTRVLGVDPNNVKALFRRAQARKMLQKYSDGIKDLKHLLDIEPKNGPAKTEMELMKNYWREQLQNIKKDMPASDSGGKTSTGKSSDGKNKPQPVKKDSKSRKRMVIEEVESDEETPPTKDTKGKKLDEKSPLSNKTKVKIEEIQKQLSKTVESLKQDGIEAQSKQTNKSDTKYAKSSKSASKKTEIKETSSGLPRVPKTVPKLEKATPYEFISAWNSLKKSDSVKPYYELLKQINPEDLTTVISNKLEGSMLNTIVRCVLEHFLKDDNIDTSFQLMHNLSKVPRFGTVSMFMSPKEKSDVIKVMEKLADHKSSLYTMSDIQKLRLAYSV